MAFRVTLDPKFDDFQRNVEDTNSDATKAAKIIMPRWAQKVNDKRLFGTRQYAPRIPAQKYVRTGRLGQNWQLRTVPNGVQFFNPTSYAAYVIGDGARNKQAGIHQGRWWLGRERIEAEVPDLVDELGEKIIEGLIP